MYAALILHDDGLEITAEKLVAITKAAGIVSRHNDVTLHNCIRQLASLGSQMAVSWYPSPYTHAYL